MVKAHFLSSIKEEKVRTVIEEYVPVLAEIKALMMNQELNVVDHVHTVIEYMSALGNLRVEDVHLDETFRVGAEVATEIFEKWTNRLLSKDGNSRRKLPYPRFRL